MRSIVAIAIAAALATAGHAAPRPHRPVIHVTVVEIDPAVVRSIVRDAIADDPSAEVDVAVTLGARPAGRDLEITARLDVVAFDAGGKLIAATTARATARGAVRDRKVITTDAIEAAAQQVARVQRTAPSSSAHSAAT